MCRKSLICLVLHVVLVLVAQDQTPPGKTHLKCVPEEPVFRLHGT